MGEKIRIDENIRRLLRLFLENKSICTDTRKLKKGDLFFALKGNNFDGNAFAEAAIEKGAAYVVVDELPRAAAEKERYIVVENALAALQALASLYREEILRLPIVAVAGSNGKTTTKELMARIVCLSYKTYFTPQNFNNHIGVPLSILAIDADCERGIIEIGANHVGEHSLLCEIVLPDILLLTNCGKDHLEGYGGMEGVIASAQEIVDYARLNDKTLILNADDEYISALKNVPPSALYYGKEENQEKNLFISGRLLHCSPFTEISIDGMRISTRLFGSFQLYNALAAAAVAKLWGISIDRIKEGIASYTPTLNRSQMIEWKNNRVILDAYNANPTSMIAMLNDFTASKEPNKIIVLGDMAEMGAFAEREHRSVLAAIRKEAFSRVVLIGKEFDKWRKEFPDYLYFIDVPSAHEWANAQGFADCFIMAKGSRSMALEKLFA